MVSLRRRKLLGLCTGKDCFPVELPKTTENNNVVESPKQNAKSFSIHPLPSVNSSPEKPSIHSSWLQVNVTEAGPGSSNASVSSSSKEEPNHYFPGKQIKHRKRHRRKLYEDQEPCLMRGVYFKNMKWQAAIKVEKKQIHLGTVGSQEAAARLYDRAAFMCGREPNFELSEEEKEELRGYNWQDFLAVTRSNINTKKHQRRLGGGSRKKPDSQPQQGSDGEERVRAPAATSSVSEEGDEDASTS